MSVYGGAFDVFFGEDRPIEFSPETPTDVSGWTFETRIVDPKGKDDTVTIAHADHEIDTEAGIVSPTLTRALTLTLKRQRYAVELWRINAGHYGKLGWVNIDVKP